MFVSEVVQEDLSVWIAHFSTLDTKLYLLLFITFRLFFSLQTLNSVLQCPLACLFCRSLSSLQTGVCHLLWGVSGLLKPTGRFRLPSSQLSVK